jgi:hypothetical protein
MKLCHNLLRVGLFAVLVFLAGTPYLRRSEDKANNLIKFSDLWILSNCSSINQKPSGRCTHIVWVNGIVTLSLNKLLRPLLKTSPRQRVSMKDGD